MELYQKLVSGSVHFLKEKNKNVFILCKHLPPPPALPPQMQQHVFDLEGPCRPRLIKYIIIYDLHELSSIKYFSNEGPLMFSLHFYITDIIPTD